jgi:hypothetical protein
VTTADALGRGLPLRAAEAGVAVPLPVGLPVLQPVTTTAQDSAAPHTSAAEVLLTTLWTPVNGYRLRLTLQRLSRKFFSPNRYNILRVNWLDTINISF